MGEKQEAERIDSPDDILRQSLHQDLEGLRPFVKEFRKGTIEQDGVYKLMLRAGVSKCYDFCEIAVSGQDDRAEFFLVATLRGVSEDLIFLRALRDLVANDRDELLMCLIKLGTIEDLLLQEAYFRKNRPFQPILHPGKIQDAEMSGLLTDIQSLWAKAGFKLGGKKSKPPTKELAQKCGLLELYEYLFSVTSDLVHFNPKVLMRSGWGTAPDGIMEFSATHFRGYYQHFGMVYGTHLLCLYFLHFKSELAPTDEAAGLISSIQETLDLMPRWPEIVTPEEMNVTPPDYQRAALHAILLNSVRRVQAKEQKS